MTERTALTIAFLAHAPASAAEVLEEIPPQEAAAFLEEVPARVAAPALACMPAWSAARCLHLLTPHRAAALLQNLAFHDAAGLVRLIRAERHAAIFDALPARMARRLRGALTYPAGSVGAWIDPELPSLPDSASVADALRFLGERDVASHVFVHLGETGQFAGAVTVTALLRTASSRTLGVLPLRKLRPLSSRATLSSVAFRDEWDDFLMLPVVGRKHTLVGGLSRGSLRKGLQEHRVARDAIPGTMTGQLLSALATTCNGLLHGMADSTASTLEEKKNA